MKAIDYLRRSLFSCLPTPSSTKPKSKKVKASSAAAPGTSSSFATVKNPLSASFADLFKDRQEEAPQEEDSLIDAAERPPSSPSRSDVIVGTIFGHRRGRVAFCVQHDPTVPPPFLFELSIPTQLLAREMRSGLLRVALECHRSGRRAWKANCNGRKVGYAVRRRPTEKDRRILEMVRSMSAGAGVLFPDDDVDVGAGAEELGELMYMRATYERVVGSRDSVSYHLINPGGSPPQELSVFLLRSG